MRPKSSAEVDAATPRSRKASSARERPPRRRPPSPTGAGRRCPRGRRVDAAVAGSCADGATEGSADAPTIWSAPPWSGRRMPRSESNPNRSCSSTGSSPSRRPSPTPESPSPSRHSMTTSAGGRPRSAGTEPSRRPGGPRHRGPTIRVTPTPDPTPEEPRVTERTLVLIKPDGVQRLLVGRILARYEERGLKIVGLKLVQVDRSLAERALRRPSREAVLRRPRRLHHVAPARRARPRGAQRDRDRPHDQRRHAPSRGCTGTIRATSRSRPPRIWSMRRTPPRRLRRARALVPPDELLDTSARSTAGRSRPRSSARAAPGPGDRGRRLRRHEGR